MHINRGRTVLTKAPNAIDFYSSLEGWIEADKEIAETLSILCSKGYLTVASCAGHTRFRNGYIWFRNGIPAKIPRGTYRDHHGSDSLRWRPNTMKGLRRVHSTLLKWAKKLPKK
jgi:hypothetical protein